MLDERHFCTFFLGNHLFGVPVLTVQEVIRYQDMTQVPLAPPVVKGLINLRGQIVMAVDLRERLGLPEQADGELPMNVVVRTKDGAVSLLVDEIGDVVEVDESTFEEAPETLDGIARDLIAGVFKLDGRLLIALDCETTVNFDNQWVA